MGDVIGSILRPEVMLRQAQAEINELREYAAQLEQQAAILEQQVKNSTRTFATLVMQCGGEVTLDRAEWERPYSLTVKTDPATRAQTWTAVRPPVVAQPEPAGTQ